MVTLMQFGQEVMFTSGGPRIAVGKQERGKNDGKKYILHPGPILFL